MKVLIVDPSGKLAARICAHVSPGYDVRVATDVEAGDWDVVYVTELSLIRRAREVCSSCPVFLLTDRLPSMEVMSHAWRQGAIGVVSLSQFIRNNGDGMASKSTELLLLETYRISSELTEQLNDMVFKLGALEEKTDNLVKAMARVERVLFDDGLCARVAVLESKVERIERSRPLSLGSLIAFLKKLVH